MRYLRYGWLIGLLAVFIAVVTAQGGAAEVQVIDGEMTDGFVFYDVFGLSAGDTLYVYLESDEFDPFIQIADINYEEVYAEDDDGGGSLNAALAFEVPEDGDYTILVTDCCSDDATGSFTLIVGFNEPAILDGSAQDTGAEIAELYIGEDAGDGDATGIDSITSGLGQDGDPQIQVIEGELVDGLTYYDLYGMRAGETLYMYLESDDFDPYIAIGDILFEEILAEDDDSGGSLNSALTYEFPEDGDYSIAVTDCCADDEEGSFRLVIGFYAPQILDGVGEDTGAEIAVLYEGSVPDSGGESIAGEGGVQEIYGAVSPETEYVFYDLFGLEEGQIIHIYAESDEFDTRILVGDINFDEVFEDDDDSGGGTNSAVTFVVPADGDYSIAITDCCRSDVSGEFRLLIGLDVPAVLTGEARPNGAEIAEAFEGADVTQGNADREGIVDCSILLERPELSGPVLNRETENFVLHYTLQGEDGATEDFVDLVVASLEDIYRIEVDEFGWAAPPRDCGEGGDDRFDIYLMEVLDEGILGYAQPEGRVGDNPASPEVEEWAAYSYLVIDNDFNGYAPPIAGMRATAAHEFNHVIQFGYDLADPEPWIYEATATWMETIVFPNDEDATPYIPDLFNEPDVCVGSLPHEDSNRIYAEWLLMDSIARDFGEDSIIQFWEIAAAVEGMDVFYEFAALNGTTPQKIIQRFAIRNLLGDYALGNEFDSQVQVEANINGTGTINPRKDGVQELGVDYVLIAKRGNYTFSIDQANLSLVVVGINQAVGAVDVYELGGRGTVDTTKYDHAYVLILNTDQHAATDECTTTDWSLSVEDGSGSVPSSPTGETYDISNFVPAG